MAWTLDKLRVSKLYRQRGNTAFQQQQWQQAAADYNQALNVLPPLTAKPDILDAHLTSVTEALVFALVNRSLCHLKLSNYAQTLRDCTRVLAWDATCEKALFRRATALYHLKRYQESLSDLQHLIGRGIGSTKLMTKPVQKLLKRVQSKVPSRPSPSPFPPTPPIKTSSILLCLLDSIAEHALYVVASFLTPLELVNCVCAGKSMQPACCSNYIWQSLCDQRWGSLYGCHSSSHGAWSMPQKAKSRGWKDLYKRVLLGEESLKVQVINRETSRNLEFTMSAYDAKVTYRVELNAWHATYLRDGRGLVCETLPFKYLRPIPADLLVATAAYSPYQLVIGTLNTAANNKKKSKVSDLRAYDVGQGVEIQWKRHLDHPFGWWYGVVSHIFYDTTATTGQVGDLVHYTIPGQAELIVMKVDDQVQTEEKEKQKDVNTEAERIMTKITVSFQQYVKASPWHQVTVVLNHKEAVRSLGGWLGGIRKSTTPKNIWEGFLPDKQIM